MKKIILVLVSFLLLGIGFFLTSQPTTEQTISKGQIEQEVSPQTAVSSDLTASFTIVTRGTTRIFTDSKYHNQSENVYIELPDPSVIHVKTSGVTWGDFFKTLPMSVSNECLVTGTKQTFCTSSTEKLRFFINDVESPHALESEITEGERLRITFGSN